MAFGAVFPPINSKIDIAFLSKQQQTATASSFNFTGLSFGPEFSTRFIVACVAWQGAAATLSSATIGGVTATILVQSLNSVGSRGTAIVCAFVPTGTTGTVVANLSISVLNSSVAVYSVDGLKTATASAIATSNANNPTASLNIAENGAVIAVAVAAFSTSPSASWTGLTEDCDDNYGTSNLVCRSTASGEFSTQQVGLAVTCTFSVTASSSGSFVVFDPQ